MKPSPFSDLKLTAGVEQATAGSDQRLFAPTPGPDEGSTLPAAKGRTSAPPHPRPRAHSNEGTSPRWKVAVPDASLEQLSERTSGDSRKATLGRALPRRVARHSHDIFQDQIRWLNRLKLELSERYDVPVTGNAMVQLAVDMLREDYVRKGGQSRLIRILIEGQPWPSRAQPDPERSEEGGR